MYRTIHNPHRIGNSSKTRDGSLISYSDLSKAQSDMNVRKPSPVSTTWNDNCLSFFGSIFKVPNVTNVGQNYICLCSGLKCPAATPCLPGFIWTASLGGNLKKETLSKYWHTSPTLSISISSAPEQRWFSPPPPLDSSCNPTFRLPMKKKVIGYYKKILNEFGNGTKKQ